MKVEKLTANTARFTFSVTPHEFEHGLEHAFAHVQKDVEIKGFRKGKVPRNVYETKYGVESLYEEALKHVLYHLIQEASNHPDYEVVGQPKVELKFEDIKRDEAFDLSFVVAIKPEVTLGEYKVEVEYPRDSEVTDEKVEAEINALFTKDATLAPKDGPIASGDTAVFDFEGFLDGEPFEGGKAENYSLVIGSKQFIPGFEEQMIGLVPGEEKDLNVTFPAAYQAENLAGKDVVFKVKLHEVKAKQVDVKIDDTWVESLNREGVKTLAELKTATKADLLKNEQEANDAAFNEAVIQKVVDAASVDIPEEMIQNEKDQFKSNVEQQAKQYNIEFEMFLSLNGLTPEQFEAYIDTESKKRVQTNLVLETVATKEGLLPTEAEVESKFAELAEQYKVSLEEVKRYIPKNLLENEIKVNKAYTALLDWAKRV